MLRFFYPVKRFFYPVKLTTYTPFNELTEDAKHSICTFLDPISLYYFSCTSKANRAIATKHLDIFDEELLLKKDTQGNQLINRVRGLNDIALNKYIFNFFKHNQDALTWGFILDQYDQEFEIILQEFDPDYFLDDDLTYLYIATVSNSLHSAEMLLKAGADPDYVSEVTPHILYVAAKEGKHEIVDLLLTYHANTEVTFNNGTALSIAASEGHVKMVKRLLEAGANINCHPHPLMLAFKNNKAEVVKFFI